VSDQQPPRREWPRVPLPPDLFELMITIARTQGYSERTLYAFIFRLLKAAHETDIEKLREYYKIDWLDEENPPGE
jgi:hypothetical protein